MLLATLDLIPLFESYLFSLIPLPSGGHTVLYKLKFDSVVAIDLTFRKYIPPPNQPPNLNFLVLLYFLHRPNANLG